MANIDGQLSTYDSRYDDRFLDRYAARSWRALQQLAMSGNDIAVHFLEMVRRYPGGPVSPQVIDDAISSALQYMASERDHLRDQLAKKTQAAAPQFAITVPAKPATDGLALADELLRFVAALPLQDHPIKVQKERAAIVNRAMMKLRPLRNKLL